MNAMQWLTERAHDFDARVEQVDRAVAAGVREFERLSWLIAQVRASGVLRPVAQYEEWLTMPVRWPGQYEKALAGLADHPDAYASTILRHYEPPEHLELLWRVARAWRAAAD